jgi:hypothetical protein
MKEFVIKTVELVANAATIHATNDDYVVTIRVERKDGQQISHADAQVAYTAVLTRLPQMIRIGK